MTRVPIPTTSLAFKAWRRRQAFATPKIAKKAEQVEIDLRILKKFTVGPHTLAAIAKNIREFEAMLRG